MSTVRRGIAWYTDDGSAALASVRLRMLLPMRELGALNVSVVRYDAAAGPGACHTLVFCKSLAGTGLDLALQARQAGVRIVYDVCDNVYDAQPGRKQLQRVDVLSRFLDLADEVVFSTDALRQQVVQRKPDVAGRCRVIPDMLESMEPSQNGLKLIERWRLARLQRFIDHHRDSLHLVWFGNNMGELSGLVHVDGIIHELEAFSAIRPVTLTVISNDLGRYRAARRHWKIPGHYIPWSLATFPAALAAHDVAIIPVKKNAYTLGKTINRPATAILAGLGVIGDAIDSYESLRPFIFLDDWRGGLAHYAATPPRSDPRLASAREFLAAQYGNSRIAGLWRDVLERESRGATMPQVVRAAQLGSSGHASVRMQ